MLMNVAPFDAVIAAGRERSASKQKYKDLQKTVEDESGNEKILAIKALVEQEHFVLLDVIAKLVELMENLQVFLRDVPGKKAERPDELSTALTKLFEEHIELMGPVVGRAEAQLNQYITSLCDLLPDTGAAGPDCDKWHELRQTNSMAPTATGLNNITNMLLNLHTAVGLDPSSRVVSFQSSARRAQVWIDFAAAVDDLGAR